MPARLVESIFGGPADSRFSGSAPETLVAESHHRIANDLSLISGIVLLHARNVAGRQQSLSNHETVLLLEEVAGRIETVARLHRLLTATDLEGESRLADYLRDVAGAVASSLSTGREHAELLYDLADDCPLSRDALAIGLIVGEVITNAIKYAHPAGVPVRIRVACRHTEAGLFVVEISDDGVGLPEGFDPSAHGGLGLRLVHSLAHQLGGTVTFEDTGLGLTVRLRVPSDQSA